MKTKKLLSFGAVLVTSLLAGAVMSTPSASALVCSFDWTGAVDSTTSNAGNWTGCSDHTVPTTGDTLDFGVASNKTVVNNLTSGTAFNLVNISGSGYNISGNPIVLSATAPIHVLSGGGGSVLNLDITLANSGTVSIDPSGGGSDVNVTIAGALNLGSGATTINLGSATNLTFSGAVSGTGAIDKTGAGQLFLGGVNTYSGATTIDAGVVTVTNAGGLGTTAGSTTVADNATLEFDLAQDATVAEPLVLSNVNGSSVATVINSSPAATTLTLSGPVQLSNKVSMSSREAPLVMSGVLSGSGGLLFADLSSDHTGSLTLAGDNTYAGVTTIDGTASIDGNQAGSAIVVLSGATLQGHGTVGAVSIQDGGHVAPGNSPGCLNTGNLSFNTGSVLDIQIAGNTACTDYDQLKVTGTVDLDGVTLTPTFLNGFAPAVGASYTIIDNNGTDKTVNGTNFVGLPEGATFKIGGTIFKISYLGGDGNDVVLTVMAAGTPVTAAPGAPDTGFGFLSAHPLTTLGVSTLAAATLAGTARRLKLAQKKAS